MKLFCDTEFNERGEGEEAGQLISLALVPETGNDVFYEVLNCPDPKPWVSEHVMPILFKKDIEHSLFKQKLGEYLSQFADVEIVADHPEDIRFFCDSIIIGGKKRMKLPNVTMSIMNLTAKRAETPHNALSDAQALRIDYLTKNAKLSDLQNG